MKKKIKGEREYKVIKFLMMDVLDIYKKQTKRIQKL